MANLAEDEADAIAQIRTFLSYLPQNVWQMPPRIEPTDDPGRRDEDLLSFIPKNKRRAYDPRKLLDLVLDRGSFFEIQPLFGRSRITGLARVHGYPVGFMVNDPRFQGGSMDKAAGEKTARLVQLCDTFHPPWCISATSPGSRSALRKKRRASFGPVRTSFRSSRFREHRT